MTSNKLSHIMFAKTYYVVIATNLQMQHRKIAVARNTKVKS